MENNRLDIAAISELKEMLEDEFDELIETYLRDTSSKLQQLPALIESSDFDAIRKVAHSMKGASVNIGILLFGDYCHRLEAEALNNNGDNFAEHMQVLQGEFDAVAVELKAL